MRLLALSIMLWACSPSIIEIEHRAEIVARLGNLNEAIELHKEALRKSDGEYEFLIKNNLAAVLQVGGQYKEAESLYRECINAGYLKSKPRLGICLAEQGKCEEALEYLTDDYFIAECLANLGRHKESAEVLGALANKNPSPLNLYNWAVELEESGEDSSLLFKEAIAKAVGDEEFLPLAKEALYKYERSYP